MPTVVVMAIRCTFSYDWFSPELCFFSWIRGMFFFRTLLSIFYPHVSCTGIAGLTAAAISIDFGFLKEGRYKVGQITLPAVYEPSSSNNQGSTQGPAKGHPKFVTPWIIDAFEVSTALRGIGWDFGKGVYIPPHPRSADNRAAFLKYMAIEHLQSFLLVDLFDLLQKLTPGVGSTDGGSIFFTNLPLIPRYALSTLLTAGTAALMMSGFRNLYATLTLIGVGLLGQSPAAWPPLLDNPWNADSLHDFWGRRWHQALRRTFLVLGGIPGGWIAGRVGTVLGAFIASGLLHEGGMYLMGRGVDHRATAFFVIQGVLVALEYIFKRVTGRRVGGNWGRAWAYVNMLSWAHLLGKYFRDGGILNLGLTCVVL